MSNSNNPTLDLENYQSVMYLKEGEPDLKTGDVVFLTIKISRKL